MVEQRVTARSAGASTRGSMERSIMITFLVMRVFYLVEAAVWILMRYPVITAGRRYALVMLGLLVVVAVESAALGSRMYRCRSVLVGRRPVVTDLTVVTIALVVVSDHVMAPDLRGPWGCGIYNVALTSAVLVGTQMTDRRTAIRCGILLVSGFWALGAVPFLAPLPAVALTGLDASWLLTYFVIAAVICVVGRQLGDTADAVRDRLAELERERSRARVQAFLPFLDPGSGSGSGEPAAVRRRHRLHRAMRAFVDGVQSPPPSRFERQSLREDIERKIVFAGVGLRGACLLVVTMAAVAQGLNSSWPAPHALAGLGVVAVESLVVGVWTHRRGRLTGARGPVAIDLLTAMAALGILLDTGHAHINGEPLDQVVLSLQDVPFHIHIDDNDGDIDAHLIPGAGNIDFAPLVGALGRIDYQGFISAELGFQYTLDPDSAVKQTHTALTRLFEQR